MIGSDNKSVVEMFLRQIIIRYNKINRISNFIAVFKLTGMFRLARIINNKGTINPVIF